MNIKEQLKKAKPHHIILPVLGVALLTSALLFLHANASDGSGTNTVSPSSVSAGSTGNDLAFTYTALETTSTGEIGMTVPSGWSAPQGNSGTAGYTTATSASGTVADVLNDLDSASGWFSSPAHMTLSADTADKQEGTGSLSNAITAIAAANEQWYFNYGGATSWGTAANSTNGQRVGMWIKSSVATSSGNLSWQDDNTASLASPEDTLAIPALTANTWTYTSVTLGAARTAQLSYGLRYTTDLGAATVKLDAASVLFDAADVTTNWTGDTNITVSAVGSGQEGTNSIRCTYASGAGTGTSGECYRTSSALTIVPGNTVSFWARSSVALASGNFAWVDDNSSGLASPSDVISMPALSANTWTYVTLSIPGLGTNSIRSYGLRQVVDKGAMTIDIDAMGTIINTGDATTGWTATAGDNMALSSDAVTFQEATASLKNVIPTTSLAGDYWYQTLGATQDWSAYTTVGLWIRSTVATAAGDLKFRYSSASDLGTAIASLNIGALTANTWSYQVLTLTGTRTTVNSYGIVYSTDIGAATVNLDDVLIGPGVPTFPGGGVIRVRLLQLTTSQTVVIHYGSGGGTSGATAPTASGISTFTTQSRVSDSGTLTNIVTQPTVTVNPGSTSQFLLNDPGNIAAGTRAAYTVTREDTNGNLVTSGTQTVYLYSDSTGNKAFYNVSSGGSPIASVTIADTASTANFWYYDDKVGTFTVTSSDNATAPDGATGIADATDSVSVSAGSTSQFLLNDPGNMTAGTRLGYTVTRKDAFNNLVTSGAQTVYLYSNSTGNKAFYAASSGGSPITSIAIADTASSANFWYYDDTSGTFTITVSDNAVAPDGATGITDATDSVTVSASSTSQFTLNDPGNMTAGTRLGYTVTRKDSFGNVTTSGAQTVYLSSDSTGNKAFYTASSGGSPIVSIAIADTASTANFWYYDDKAGTFTVTASDNATAPDGTTGIDDATDSVSISTATIALFTLDNPGDMTAGTRLGYTVTRKDAFNNLVTSGAQTVYLYSNSTGNKAFYAASSGGSPIVSIAIADTSSTANFWYYDDKAGTFTVTASDNATAPDGATGIADATDSVTISASSTSQFTLNDPGSMTAGTRLGYTVTRKDAFGNVTTSGAQTVYLYSNSTGNKAFYAASSGGSPILSVAIIDTASTADFWYYDDKSGTFTVTASDNATAPDGVTGIVDATDSVTVSAATTTQFLLNDPGNITAGTRAGYTVTRKDAFNNLVTSGAQTVYLYSDSTGNKAFYSVSTGGSPIVSIVITDTTSSVNFWYYDDKAGTFTVTASDNAVAPNGATGIDDATDSVTIFATATAQFTLNDPGSVAAGLRLGYTVTRKDAFNNLVTTGPQTVYFYSDSTGNKAFYTASSGGSPVTSISIADTTSSVDFWYYDDTTGTFTITASDNATAPDGTTGIDDATDSLTVTQASTSQFLLNDPGNMTAGTRLGYTVTRKDVFGNLVTSGSDIVSLYSDSTGNAAFYSVSSGGSPVTSITITNGNSTANFWYYDDKAGTFTVTASDNAVAPDGATGIDDATDSVTVVGASASQFLLNDPGDMTAGTRLGYTVTRKDSFNNLVTSGAQTVYLYSNSTGNKAFYAASSGGSPIVSIAIIDTASTANFWYYDDKVGTFTVTASDNATAPDGATGIADATDSVTVSAGSIAQFLLNDPGNMTAGDRLGYTVTRKDAFNNLVTSGAQTVYLYSDSTGNSAFYAASSGGSPIASVSIIDTASTANFWYYDDKAGTFTVTASDNAIAPNGTTGIDDATDSVTVFAAAASQFILNDPGNVGAGTRLGYTVTRKDTFNNLVTSGPQTVYLSSDSSNSPQFFTASSGGSPVTFITITDTASTANFWYYDEAAGTATVTASDNATAPDGTVGVDDATDSVTITQAPASQFLLNDPGTMTAGTRLGYTVTRKDVFGNLVTTGSNVVNLYADSTGNKAFYTASSGGSPVTSVTITDTTSSVNFWYYDDKAGTLTVTASDNATAPDGATGIADATDSVTVSAAATAQFLLSDPGNMTINTRLGYTVTRKDAFNNLVTSGSDSVHLYSDSTGSPAFYAVAVDGSPITSIAIADTTSSVDFWYFDDTVGTPTVTASDSATAPDGTVGVDDATDSVTVSAPAAIKFTIVQPANGTVETATVVTVRAEDTFGNVTTNYQNDVTLVASGSATGDGLVNIVNGIGTLSISDTVIETVTLTLLDSESTGLDVSSTKNVDFTAGPTRQFTLNDPGNMTAGTRLGYTMTRKDSLGNMVTSGSDTVYLYSDSTGNKAFYSASVDGSLITSITITDGNATADFWYYDDKVASVTVTGSDNATAPDGLTNIDDATDSVVVNADVSALFELNNPGDLIAGARLGYTVTRKDQFGNTVTSGTETVYLYGDSTGNKAFYNAASGGSTITSLSVLDGNTTADFWYYDDKAGTFSVTVSDNATAPDGTTGVNDASDSFIVSPDATTQFLLNDPGDMTVSTRTGYVVTRKDVFNNLVTAGSDTAYLYTNSTGLSAFYTVSVDGSPVTSITIDNGFSTGTFWYFDDTAGSWTITASDNASAPDGTTGIDDGTDSITVTDIPIIATRFVIQNPTDGTVGDTISVTVRAEDDFGSVDTSIQSDVTLVVSGAASGGGVVDIVNGTGTLGVSDTTAQTVSLSLSDSQGTGLNTSSTQDVVFATGPVTQYLVNDPGDTTAGTRIAYTVTRKDQFGNSVIAGSQSVYLFSTLGGTAKFFDAASGGSQITSAVISGGSSSANFWYSYEQTGSDTVTASDNITAPDGATGITDATDGIAITPGATFQYTLNNPGDMTVNTRVGYTVTRKDAFGNLVTSGNETASLYTNSTGAAVFYDAATAGNALTAVVIGNGSSSASFWYFDNTDGFWTITASDNATAPDGTTGVHDSADTITVTTITITATRFIIQDPADGTVGSNVSVTVRAEDDFGSVDTTIQTDVTLLASGSATGGGLVDIVNGIGTMTITDAVAEAVTLSLSDTEGTGLDVSSAQSVTFASASVPGGAGPSTETPTPTVVEKPVVPILRFSGQAYPGATANLFGQTATEKLFIMKTVVASPDGTFALDYSDPLPSILSYSIEIADAQQNVAPPVVFTAPVTQDAVTVLSLLASTTLHVLQSSVLHGLHFSITGSAVPKGRVELSVDGNDPVQFVQADNDGLYQLFLETLDLDFGEHTLRTRQTTPDGQVSDYSIAQKVFVTHLLNKQMDLNGDDAINITDWSIFLVRWLSTDAATRLLLDFNSDGVVNISDLSIFIRTLR